MGGMATFLFTLGVVLAMGVVYSGGMAGWITAAFMLLAGWMAMLILQWADAGALAVQALLALVTMGMALRWVFAHQHWMERIAKDRREADEKHQQIQGVVADLKSRIAIKVTEVDRGLKQYELVRRLAEANSWEEMSPSLDKALKHFFQTDSWSLYFTDEKNELQVVHRRGVTPEPRAEDLPRKEPFLHTFVPNSGIDQGRTVWAMGLPLWRVHERIGLLVIRVPDTSPDQHNALLAEAANFSVQLIFAMAKAKLYRELDRRSRTDGLTGLSRRGPFEERLREEIARARSFRTTFSILMIDIDHFKNLNDTYGHQVGDEVLKTVSSRIQQALYETDVIARFGGEEFVCLLPRSQPAGLRIKADQIRQKIANESFVIGLDNVTVTISLGIAHFPSDGDSPEAILAAADRALYAAKAAGRNCVIEAATGRP